MAIAGNQIMIDGGAYTNEIVDIGLLTSHTFTGLDPDTEYSFKHRHYDRFEQYSEWSDVETLSTPSIPDDPGDFSQCVHWQRAKDITGVSDGAEFSPWEDSKGSADLSETGGNRPTYHANGGDPFVRFGGSDFLKTNARTNLTGDFTHIMVIDLKTAPDYSRICVYTGGNGIQIFTLGTTLFYYINGSGLTRTIPSRPTGKMVIFFEREGSNGKLRVNGSEVTGTVNTSPTSANYAMAAEVSGTDKTVEDVYEECIFDDNLSSDIIDVLEAYFLAEHGVTL